MFVLRQNVEQFDSNLAKNHNSSWDATSRPITVGIRKIKKILPKISDFSQILHLRGNSGSQYVIITRLRA